MGTVGDFVFLACLGSNPRKVRNSAINDTTGWSVGVNLCDEQELPDGDNITGFSGGEFGWVVQQHAIRRVIFQPGFDQAFRFERDERERGAIGPYSVVGVRDTIFFKADDGFYSFGPAGLKPIGHLRVDGFFATNSDTKRYPLGFSDPTGPRVFWVYYSSANATLPDRKLIYDWDQDEWSAEEETAQFWARLVTAGTTLEGLNIYGSIDYPSAGAGPGIPYPLDSPVWQGGVPVVGAITSAGLLAFKSGAPNTATLTTCPLQLVPEGRANVANVFPAGIFNDATVALRIGRREHSAAAVSYTPSLTPSSKSGIARTKASGRLHNVELTLSQSSGTNWEHAIGVDLEANQDGRK